MPAPCRSYELRDTKGFDTSDLSVHIPHFCASGWKAHSGRHGQAQQRVMPAHKHLPKALYMSQVVTFVAYQGKGTESRHQLSSSNDIEHCLSHVMRTLELRIFKLTRIGQMARSVDRVSLSGAGGNINLYCCCFARE
jgi:hypothetical protein